MPTGSLAALSLVSKGFFADSSHTAPRRTDREPIVSSGLRQAWCRRLRPPHLPKTAPYEAVRSVEATSEPVARSPQDQLPQRALSGAGTNGLRQGNTQGGTPWARLSPISARTEMGPPEAAGKASLRQGRQCEFEIPRPSCPSGNPPSPKGRLGAVGFGKGLPLGEGGLPEGQDG